MTDQANMNEKPPYPTAGPPMPQPEVASPPPYQPPPPGGYQNTQPPPGYFSQPQQQGPPPPGVPVQQPGYPAGYPAPNTAIIVGARWSEVPQFATCNSCNEQVMTSVSYVAGSLTWLLCFIIVIFCGWLFCLCLIPFCIDGCKDVIHSCPNCNRQLGVCKRG